MLVLVLALVLALAGAAPDKTTQLTTAALTTTRLTGAPHAGALRLPAAPRAFQP